MKEVSGPFDLIDNNEMSNNELRDEFGFKLTNEPVFSGVEPNYPFNKDDNNETQFGYKEFPFMKDSSNNIPNNNDLVDVCTPENKNESNRPNDEVIKNNNENSAEFNNNLSEANNNISNVVVNNNIQNAAANNNVQNASNNTLIITSWCEILYIDGLDKPFHCLYTEDKNKPFAHLVTNNSLRYFLKTAYTENMMVIFTNKTIYSPSVEPYEKDFIKKLYDLKTELHKTGNKDKYFSELIELESNLEYNMIDPNSLPCIDKPESPFNEDELNEFDFTDKEKVDALNKKLENIVQKESNSQKGTESDEKINKEPSKSGFVENNLFPKNINASSIKPLSVESTDCYKKSIAYLKHAIIYTSKLGFKEYLVTNNLFLESTRNISSKIFMGYICKDPLDKIKYLEEAINNAADSMSMLSATSNITHTRYKMCLYMNFEIREIITSLLRWKNSIKVDR